MTAGSPRPNLLFIMSDEHAAHALSAYGSRINTTPQLDRIAEGGMRFDNAFCTNSICAPSRAAILTGTYNHRNGVITLDTPLDNTLWTFPQQMQEDGYQTALIGKWHLGHGPGVDPAGFDHWRVLPGQGHYHNPVMLEAGAPSSVTTRPPTAAGSRADVTSPSMTASTFPEPHTFADDLAGRAAVCPTASP